MNSNLTYVTSFIDIYNKKIVNNRNIVWRFEQFFNIVESNVQLCVYVDENSMELLQNYASIFSNIKIMGIADLKNTFAYNTCQQYIDATNKTIQLPVNKCIHKDTYEYMIMINSKIEYVYDAIEKNPFNSTHFAWIDFSLSHMFTNLNVFKSTLKLYSQLLLHPSFLAIPGCWNKPVAFSNEHFIDFINWRFCGSFFIGDADSIRNFYFLYRQYFPEFIFKYNTLVWEVNFWTWLELISDWKPQWYLANHNDSNIIIPPEFFLPPFQKVT